MPALFLSALVLGLVSDASERDAFATNNQALPNVRDTSQPRFDGASPDHLLYHPTILLDAGSPRTGSRYCRRFPSQADWISRQDEAKGI